MMSGLQFYISNLAPQLFSDSILDSQSPIKYLTLTHPLIQPTGMVVTDWMKGNYCVGCIDKPQDKIIDQLYYQGYYDTQSCDNA